MAHSMFDVFRAVVPDGGQHKGTSNCKAKRCPKSTRDGKPYCSRHIEEAPYVKAILKKLANRAKEEKLLVEAKRSLAPDSFLIRETILLLRTKDYSAKGLARRLDIPHVASKRLIFLMNKKGLAKRHESSRGEVSISGLGERDLREIDEDK